MLAPDAQAQGGHDGQREDGALHEQPRGVPEVVPKATEARRPIPPRGRRRGRPGGRGRQGGLDLRGKGIGGELAAHQRVGLFQRCCPSRRARRVPLLELLGQLLDHVRLLVRIEAERGQPLAHRRAANHAWEVLTTRFTAATNARQVSFWSASTLRPAAVSR